MRYNQLGQSLTEFIVIAPLFFLLIMGLFEFSYIYRAKATLNTATFEAARAGALNNADMKYAESVLVRGMLPLYMNAQTGRLALTSAYLRAEFDSLMMNRFLRTVSVVSPTKAIFDAFKVKRRLKLVNSLTVGDVWVIPNDGLLSRSSHSSSVGKNMSINIQDANLLKIKTVWCYELKVPILRELLVDFISSAVIYKTSDEQRACNRVALLTGSAPRLAIVSHSTVRMQSHIIDKDLK